MSARRYRLSHPSEPKNKRFTVLNHRRFSFARLDKAMLRGAPKASLWNISPTTWPSDDLDVLIHQSHKYSQSRAHLVLWVPDSELHRGYIRVEDISDWTPCATILSGHSCGMSIGKVYSKGSVPIKQPSNILFDERQYRGSGSSITMKFILENLMFSYSSADTPGLVVEPFTHRSGELAVWTHRMGMYYRGYTGSKKTFSAVKEKLAQVELPGIQISLPAT